MFAISESAQKYLLETIKAERRVPEEVLFLRLSMGIG